MDVNDEALLNSGFSSGELQKIKNNVKIYGGTLEEAIQDLANRFRIVIWVTSACFLVFSLLVLFTTEQTMVGGGISLLVAVVIVIFIQPPILSWKSWRFWRANRKKAL